MMRKAVSIQMRKGPKFAKDANTHLTPWPEPYIRNHARTTMRSATRKTTMPRSTHNSILIEGGKAIKQGRDGAVGRVRFEDQCIRETSR